MEKEMRLMVSENLEVTVQMDEKHEYLMSTAEVAAGYGVSPNNIRKLKMENADELKSGVHFIKGGVTKGNDLSKSNNYNESQRVWWTKRGIVRLGFSIRSERAKLFRDWAEDLIIAVDVHVEKVKNLGILPDAPKRNHNRLSRERLLDLLGEVAKIENTELRLTIINKLLNK